MSRAMTIAGREWRAYFLSTSGYVITALFALFAGLFFVRYAFANGQVASMRPVFASGTWILAFIAPAITMRLLSEEFRMHTYETLITAPVRHGDIIVGKYLGAMGLLIIMLAPTLVFMVLLERYGRPDYGEVACGYLGLLLAGSAYVASGLFVSTLTSSQPVSFLVTMFFWITIGLGTKELPAMVPDWLATFVYAADPELRLRDFTIGLIDSSNVVYFVAITAFFLIASMQSLAARKWPS
ncbi:MAG: ABC transporter permease [Planctomycetota bacterium]